MRRDGSRGSTVFADAGDFTISTRLEPADSPILSWTKALTKNTGTGQYYTELLEEIRRRAPNCQWTIDPFYRLFRNEPSCLVRDSWMPALLVLLIFILPTLIIILLTVLD